jgi:Putative peptidoglycan binding domain
MTPEVMRRSFAVIVALGLCGGTVFAKGNNGSGGGSRTSAAPSAPVAAPVSAVHTGRPVGPIGSGLSNNLSGSRSYRPVTISENGHRTLVYPAVGNSAVHRQGQSNLNALNAGNTGKVSTRSGKLSPTSPTGLVTKTKLDPQTSARLRHWNGNVSSATQARLNNTNHSHHHHDRDWWKDHCLTVIFFDWGWWGWYDGWWYPAWGYDPYSYYEYNEPIYGQSGLTPDQIVAGVQASLQQRGYYTYAIDGRMGPLTRAAIGRYQSDHRLPVSYGIDAATLGSLGIIH